MSSQPDANQDAYAEEREKLDNVIRAIQSQTSRIGSGMPARAGDTRTADAVQEIFQRQVVSLESALRQPYFGRVDYQQLDPLHEAPKTIYIGGNHIPDTNVVSWIAPVARLWYTNENRYNAPRGQVRVRVDLKRFLRVRGQELVELNDIYRRALPEGAPTANAALTAALSGTGAADGHLSTIIETIEADQYENIANVSDQVLIVQGAAGSGKSEIGLHRIAYLLSPFNELPQRERPTANTTLFVGPSDSFLEYAADVLPNLGVRDNIQQTTLRAWLAYRHSDTVNIGPRMWRNLLEKGAMTDFDETAEAFKGSMGMADALERHVKNRLDEIRKAFRNLPPLNSTPAGRRLAVSESDIDAALRRVFANNDGGSAPNVKRQQFVDAITDLIWARDGLAVGTRREEVARRRNRIAAEVISPWLETRWPRLDFQQEYVSLLTNPELLSRLSRDSITVEGARKLQASARYAASGEFGDSDIGALTYLDHLLNNTIRPHYRHIVVDEAQDISPIEFQVLHLSSVNNWFTVLGDTVQQITPYRGIRRWRDLERALGRSAIKVQHARTSYRSNQHITRFNNRILRLFDTYIDAPIPYGREGHRVEFHRHASSESMYRNVVGELQRIRSLDDMADAQIAILVRDRYNLRQFEKFCRENEIDEVTPFGPESHHANTILCRIPDAKGLEYDAVIIMGVNEAFASTTFNRKLLYLAATRAKHYLAIHWARKQSPITRAISDRGIRKFNPQ